MKKNTLKILLSTAAPSDRLRPIAAESLHRFVVPNLSKAGLRSLLYLMKEKGYIKLQSASSQLGAAGGAYVFGQSEGWRSLLAAIPALRPEWSSWQGDWACLVFLQAPASDRQFRYLRSFCLNHHYFQLTRGVYLAPTWYLKQTLLELEGVYRHSIQVLTVGEWVGGDVREQILEHFDVMGLSTLYSGISNQYQQLLESFVPKKRLNEQQIKYFRSIFERTHDLLLQDLGLVWYYTNSMRPPLSLVESWQSLLLLLGEARLDN